MKRVTLVLLDSSDHLASRERRETEACQDPRARVDPKETQVLLAKLVHSALSDPQDCPVPQAPKEPRVHLVKLVPRESMVSLAHLVHLVLPAMSSILCP